jgi:hypothetical protein
MRARGFWGLLCTTVAAAVLAAAMSRPAMGESRGPKAAQQSEKAGRSIGKVSIRGGLIVLELSEGALAKANLFDLAGRTLRFVAKGSQYQVESGPLRWDADFGGELTGARVNLQKFTFPFSGRQWKSLLVGATGSIRFNDAESEPALDPYGHADAGIILDRFDQLGHAVAELDARGPAICVFLKPRMSGTRFVKELPDRVVITWDLTEPFGGLLDFGWHKTTNRFQAVLYADGSVEMSYKEMDAKDGIVGIYAGGRPEAVHFSSLAPESGAYGSVYESFHYLGVPRAQDLSCTVLKALGDNFDFLAYYADFRIDSQEASTPSDGPIGGNVTGIGDTKHDQSKPVLASRCTQGKFQLGFAQPVYAGANEMQEGPPSGAPAGNRHDITFYQHAGGEDAVASKRLRYNYAVGHLGHEVGHRWSAYASAKVNGETISLGPWPHWAPGLQAPVAFPYSLPIEASTLGGGVWQDNQDGTYTQLKDGYFVPASGYSYLDLYLMGLLPALKVPDFYLLKNLQAVGKDKMGHPVFKAEKMKVTVKDVVAAEGLRLPDFKHSQRKFNTGIVVIVEHGRRPSRKLMEQAEGIREQWLEYWDTATGHAASMTADPR